MAYMLLKRGVQECVATPGVPACDWLKPQLHSFLAEYPNGLTWPQGGGRCPLRFTGRGGGPSGGHQFKIDQESTQPEDCPRLFGELAARVCQNAT